MNDIFNEQFTRTLEDAQLITESYDSSINALTELSKNLTGHKLRMAQYAIKILKNLFGPANDLRRKRSERRAEDVAGHYKGFAIDRTGRVKP